MKTRERLTVTIPCEVLAAARRDVKAGLAKSVSAWITDAAEAKAMQETVEDVLADLLEESGGPMTEEERRWATQQLGL